MVSEEELYEVDAYKIMKKYKDKLQDLSKTDDMIALIHEQLRWDVNSYIKEIGRVLKETMQYLLLYRYIPELYQTHESLMLNVKHLTQLNINTIKDVYELKST